MFIPTYYWSALFHLFISFIPLRQVPQQVIISIVQKVSNVEGFYSSNHVHDIGTRPALFYGYSRSPNRW